MKKYIVLDLDSTLVNTFPDLDVLDKLNVYTDYSNFELRKRMYTIDLYDVIDDPGTGTYTRMCGVFRPGWQRFHDFIFKHYEIIVWSAGQPRYVDAIVNKLFINPKFQPQTVYTSDNCQDDEFENIYKPLEILIKNYNNLTIENILAVDDREDTFSHNVKNGILIPAYSPDQTRESILQYDDTLLKLELWLTNNDVSNCKDVRKLNKKNIFKE